ncbi:MAG: hypothetical protein ABRQ37_03315 [Candidatus Eremiobacterota bacterium]
MTERSDPEGEIESLETEQFSCALKYIVDGILNAAGARYFFLELNKIGQMKGEFLKDGILSFQSIDILKKRFDSSAKLLDTLRYGRRSPSTSLRKEDIIEREQNRIVGQVIYELSEKNISCEDALAVIQEQYRVVVYKGKCHDAWSGQISPSHRDEILEKIYLCEKLLKEFRAKKKIQEKPLQKVQAKPSPVVRPVYEKEYLNKGQSDFRSARSPIHRRRMEKEDDRKTRKVFLGDGEEDTEMEHSFRWGRFMEDATSRLMGGNIKISIDDDQLGILNKLPVKKYTFPSQERLPDLQDKKKSPISPEILKELEVFNEEKKLREMFSRDMEDRHITAEDGKEEKIYSEDKKHKVRIFSQADDGEKIEDRKFFSRKRDVIPSVPGEQPEKTEKKRLSIFDVKSEKK